MQTTNVPRSESSIISIYTSCTYTHTHSPFQLHSPIPQRPVFSSELNSIIANSSISRRNSQEVARPKQREDKSALQRHVYINRRVGKRFGHGYLSTSTRLQTARRYMFVCVRRRQTPHEQYVVDNELKSRQNPRLRFQYTRNSSRGDTAACESLRAELKMFHARDILPMLICTMCLISYCASCSPDIGQPLDLSRVVLCLHRFDDDLSRK